MTSHDHTTTEYLLSRATDIAYAVSLLENMGCSRTQVAHFIEGDDDTETAALSLQNKTKLGNVSKALAFLEENGRYPLELGTLAQYNLILGEGDPAHPSPGYIRDDAPAPISGCSYTAPPISGDEARKILMGYHDFDSIEDKVAYLAVELPKAQIFYDGNKRATLFTCNHLLCHEDAQMVFFAGNKDEHDLYLDALLGYYVGDIERDAAMDAAKRLLKPME